MSNTQVSAYVTLAARKNVLEENGDDPGLASGSIINFQHICTVQPESSRQLKFKQPLLWNTALPCSTHLQHEPPLVADGYPAEVLDKVTAEERVSIRKAMPDRSTARDFRQPCLTCILRILHFTTSLTTSSRNQYVHENDPIRPARQRASSLQCLAVQLDADNGHRDGLPLPDRRYASVSVPSNPPPTNIGGGVAGITPQLENLLSDLRQLDSLLTSVSSAVTKLLSTVTDLHLWVDQPVGTVADDLLKQIQRITGEVGNINGILSGITSGAAKPTCGNQISTVGQRTLNQLTGLVDQINKIIGALEKCKANTAKLATLKAARTDLVGKLSILYPRLSSDYNTPAHADALTAAYQNLLHTLNN
ncbi:hypothetical protein DFH08DRAFT_940991 [Mycena albidolilacea]|uniref:Uncharacterized protein n=1 Tax=Mycena albidolilacea TaxID=1033008 RepID=A0AAD6ZK84_9AGAR|nr:hypothetical protein DFH08DRAFT_940991 [Mycena albidolilacea]